MKPFFPQTGLDIMKTVQELLSTNRALGTRVGNAKSCKLDAPAAKEAANAKLERMRSDANKVVKPGRRQPASSVSVQVLAADKKALKLQMVNVNVKSLSCPRGWTLRRYDPTRGLKSWLVCVVVVTALRIW